MGTHLAQVYGEPYVSVAGFRAHPTYLDLQNLRSGITTQVAQDAALYNILVEATAEADKIIGQPLQAHIKVDSPDLSPGRLGRLSFHPTHNPVRRVMTLSYGTLVGAKTDVQIVNPEFRYGDNQILTVQLGSVASSWSGGLQLGGPATSARLFTAFTYVAGYANGKLAADTLVGASSITVDNPLGIEPGDTLRSWEPGAEEQAVVAPGYVPVTTVTPTAVPLVSPLINAHIAGSHISAVPPDAYLATVYLTMEILSRPGEGGTGKGGPGAKITPQSQKPKAGGQVSTWRQRAEALLGFYRGVV